VETGPTWEPRIAEGVAPGRVAGATGRDEASGSGSGRRSWQTRSNPLTATTQTTTTGNNDPDASVPDIAALDDSVQEAVPLTASDFASLGVRAETVTALREQGIVTAFPIQELTLPLALSGADLIGQARTGTGKTLAFGIPLLEKITGPHEGADGRPQALVVVPTRELCVQVTGDLTRAGVTRGVRTLAVYGGRAYEPQVKALGAGVEIVVGTPGRLLDLARQRLLDLHGVRMLVLDEADEMLDLGFLPDVERIVDQIPQARQTMLFSATMPGPVVALARRFMSRPVHVTAEQPDEGRTVPATSQHVFRAHAMDKAEMLARILQAGGRGLSIVFARTKRTADKVAEDLVRRGFAAAAVHGDLGQGQREQALRAFRAGKIDVLVATDVAARGIDVSGVTHVVNYQCPEDEKVYLHRIGRTGRAGESGVAVTFVDWDDLTRWSLVNDALKLPFADPPETYSTSPHLYAALGIPQTASSVLPRAERTRAGIDAEEVEDIGETGRRTKRRAPEAPVAPRERAAPRRSSRSRQRTRGAGAALSAVGADGQVEPGPATQGPATQNQDTQGQAAGGQAAGGQAAGGQAAGGNPTADAPAPTVAAAHDSGVPPVAVAVTATDATEAPSTLFAAAVDTEVPAATGDAPRRRRRRRGGRGRGRGTTTAGAAGTDEFSADDSAATPELAGESRAESA
jgi:superfamily II DNA/RNA helicase